MKHNKEIDRETIIIEVMAWVAVIGIFYICAKAIL